MATYFPAKLNTQYIFYAGLVSQADTRLIQTNPTIASGDFKVSIDGGALANLGTLPAVTPASSKMVKFTLSTSEMNGANITIVCSDAAGAEWCDAVFNIQTAARQIDDLAYPATSGRSMVVDASGLVDANTVKVGPTGSGTAQTAGDIPSRQTDAVLAAAIWNAATASYGSAGSYGLLVETDLDATVSSRLAAASYTAPPSAASILATQITEAYRANGAAPTLAQFMSEVLAHLGESSIAGTTKTVKKMDHATTAETFTLDSATVPTSITRAT